MFKKIINSLGLGRTTNRRASKPPGKGTLRRLRYEALEDRRMLATLTVNVTNDNVGASGVPIDNDGFLTLRDAIAYVNGTATPVGLETNQINQEARGTRIFVDGSNVNYQGSYPLSHP